MTTAARAVLADCRGALAELVDGLEGATWRRRWITVVVLLRAVGHVLESVDGATSPRHQAANSRWWNSLKSSRPKPEIFWLFIFEERNAIVKEYQINAGHGVTTQLRGMQ